MERDTQGARRDRGKLRAACISEQQRRSTLKGTENEEPELGTPKLKGREQKCKRKGSAG